MLILTRKVGQTIDLTYQGVRIEITVVEQTGNKIRLGIHAPDDVRIDRREVTQLREAR